jgi:hypothetical protein
MLTCFCAKRKTKQQSLKNEHTSADTDITNPSIRVHSISPPIHVEIAVSKIENSCSNDIVVKPEFNSDLTSPTNHSETIVPASPFPEFSIASGGIETLHEDREDCIRDRVPQHCELMRPTDPRDCDNVSVESEKNDEIVISPNILKENGFDACTDHTRSHQIPTFMNISDVWGSGGADTSIDFSPLIPNDPLRESGGLFSEGEVTLGISGLFNSVSVDQVMLSEVHPRNSEGRDSCSYVKKVSPISAEIEPYNNTSIDSTPTEEEARRPESEETSDESKFTAKEEPENGPLLSVLEGERTLSDDTKIEGVNDEIIKISDSQVTSDSEEPEYIDEHGIEPVDQYNTSSTAVPFFSPAAATMGYSTARLLQFRMNGIVSIPGVTKNDRRSM